MRTISVMYLRCVDCPASAASNTVERSPATSTTDALALWIIACRSDVPAQRTVVRPEVGLNPPLRRSSLLLMDSPLGLPNRNLPAED